MTLKGSRIFKAIAADALMYSAVWALSDWKTAVACFVLHAVSNNARDELRDNHGPNALEDQ